MKRFQFSLESVLRYRREIEEEWEIKLARVNGEYNRILQEIERNRSAERSALEGCSRAVGEEARSWGVYRLRLEGTLRQLEMALAAKERELERIRKKYRDVSRDRKVVSRLKEKKQGEYKNYVIREEIKAIDGVSAVRHLAGEGD